MESFNRAFGLGFRARSRRLLGVLSVGAWGFLGPCCEGLGPFIVKLERSPQNSKGNN